MISVGFEKIFEKFLLDDTENDPLKRRPIFAGIVCVISFLLAVPMTTSGGMYIFQDWLKSIFVLTLSIIQI